MKKIISIITVALLIVSCKDNSSLTFSKQVFEKKSDLGCTEYCPVAKLEISHFEEGIIADSINIKVFLTFKEIISFEEEPYKAKDYNELLSSFISSYENLKKEFPSETIGWEASGESTLSYQNEKIINININYYIFTGGAHGYSGTQSLFFDIKTGKNLSKEDVLENLSEFREFSEKKFREKFNINPTDNINSTGFMFENEIFELPQTIIFTKNGILLFYNTYEIASYADGPQELLIPYEEAKSFLKLF